MPSSEPRRFLIAGAWRTGTLYTLETIGAHDQVTFAPLEVLPWPLFTAGFDMFCDNQSSFDGKRRFVRAAFDQLACRAEPLKTPVMGAKTAVRDLGEACEVLYGLEYFLDDVAVIVTRRHDLVARFASTLRATASQVWHVQRSAKVERAEAVELPEGAFRRFVRECREVDAALDLLSDQRPVAVVDYERDVLGGGGLDHVFEFLGLEPHHRPVDQGKVTPPIEDWVRNVEALREIEDQTPAPGRDEIRAACERRVADMTHKDRVDVKLARARFLQSSKQFERGFDLAAETLATMTLPVTEARVRALRVLKWCFRPIAAIDRLEQALPRLRDRFGHSPEFAELEAELARAKGEFDEAIERVEAARAAGPDCETVHRLSRLEEQIHRERRQR
ncbi:MAG: hypothetical protein KAI24_10895 [Planctomycetes bacterium]|nr:hypothetical protein [Planctomycetota bacterium]